MESSPLPSASPVSSPRAIQVWAQVPEDVMDISKVPTINTAIWGGLAWALSVILVPGLECSWPVIC